ncbi:MAG TPA: PQQ-dependent sugar dehydrogenase [Acidimicrobiales bacterium]|nr:PQQ-dependent sugar dehydrogenase [Acidimicrobiales bacterium]
MSLRGRSAAAAIGTVLATALVAAGCGGDDSSSAPDTTVPAAPTTASAPPPPSTTTAPPPAPTPSSAPAPRNYNFAQPEVIASGLSVPWGVAFLPDGSALISERAGRILQLRAGAAPQVVMTVPGVRASGESGLLGLAVSPTYAQDGLVYAYLTTSADNRVERFKLGGEPEVIVSGIAAATIHDGGRIAFGPDGFLYIATGDGSSSSRAQNPGSPNGKILRVLPDGSPAPGNPDPASAVWTLGHRNVQGLAWDAAGRLFATEFGQNTWDEINLIEPGKNYGWPAVEGTGGKGAFTDPLVTWRTSESSPSGDAVSGAFLYVAALRGKRLWRIPITPGGLGEPEAVIDGDFGRLRTVVVAPDGALWVTTSNRDGRGSPAGSDDRILRFAPVP